MKTLNALAILLSCMPLSAFANKIDASSSSVSVRASVAGLPSTDSSLPGKHGTHIWFRRRRLAHG